MIARTLAKKVQRRFCLDAGRMGIPHKLLVEGRMLSAP